MEARLLLVYVGLTVRPLYSMADVSNADEGKGRLRCTTTDSHISEGPRVLCLSCAINDSFRVQRRGPWPRQISESILINTGNVLYSQAFVCLSESWCIFCAGFLTSARIQFKLNSRRQKTRKQATATI